MADPQASVHQHLPIPNSLRSDRKQCKLWAKQRQQDEEQPPTAGSHQSVNVTMQMEWKDGKEATSHWIDESLICPFSGQIKNAHEKILAMHSMGDSVLAVPTHTTA